MCLLQGESNTDSSADALHYGCMFRVMIADLRRHQPRQDAPFFFVLFSPAHNGTNGSLPLIQGWQSQQTALALPNTGIANTVDLGDVSPLINELHPRNKSLIGQRLARLSLRHLYGQHIGTLGPTLDLQSQIRARMTQDDLLQLTLSYPMTAENSLLHVMGTAECDACCNSTPGGLLAVRLGDVSYFPSSLSIDVTAYTVRADVRVAAGVNASSVELQFESYDSYPQCALYNADNLPALPFRVDVPLRRRAAAAVLTTAS